MQQRSRFCRLRILGVVLDFVHVQVALFESRTETNSTQFVGRRQRNRQLGRAAFERVAVRLLCLRLHSDHLQFVDATDYITFVLSNQLVASFDVFGTGLRALVSLHRERSGQFGNDGFQCNRPSMLVCRSIFARHFVRRQCDQIGLGPLRAHSFPDCSDFISGNRQSASAVTHLNLNQQY